MFCSVHLAVIGTTGAAGPLRIVSLIAAGLVVAALIILIIQRKRRQRRQRIEAAQSGLYDRIEKDLGRLQLDDTCRLLADGWNRLIDDVESARQDMEAYQSRSSGGRTTYSTQSNWPGPLLDQVPYGLIAVTDDWMITFANQAAARILGMNSDSLRGRRATEFFEQDISRIRVGAGETFDQTCTLKSTQALIHITVARCGDDADRGETALILQTIEGK